MAMTYAQQTTFKLDTAWQDAVCQAALAYARTVQAESASGVDNHTLRATFAYQVLSEPDLWKLPITAAVATDAALSTTPSDADLLAAVEDAWDALAGVPGPA